MRLLTFSIAYQEHPHKLQSTAHQHTGARIMASTSLDSYQYGQGIFEINIEKHEPVFVLHYTLCSLTASPSTSLQPA